MATRRAVSILPFLVLAACMDRELTTAPEGLDPSADLSLQSVTLEVQNLNDSGAGSLRQAVADAGDGHVITFASALAAGTVTLTSEVVIDKSLTVVGPAGGITISGGDATRIFRIPNVYEVVLDNLTLAHGSPAPSAPVPAVGGAIFNAGNLTIRNSTLRDNWAEGAGGAIEHRDGTLTILNSTLSGNGRNPSTGDLTDWGGAIRSIYGTVAITNSTISGNSADTGGGGLVNNKSTVMLTHATVAANGASGGGGIFNYGQSTTHAVTSLVNSIVADNISATTSGGPDIRNYSVSSSDRDAYVTLTASYSLVGEPDGHNLTQTGDTYVGVDPRFALDGFGKPALADNGGPTQTHALQGDSPAIDAAASGPCAAAPVNSLDQRGFTRPQGAACDMGASEVAGAVAPPQPDVSELSISGSSTVDKTTGTAILNGTMTCSAPGAVELEVELSQQQKAKRISHTVAGSTTLLVSCNGVTPWAAAVVGDNGVFVNGSAWAMGATLNAVSDKQASLRVKLSWSK